MQNSVRCRFNGARRRQAAPGRWYQSDVDFVAVPVEAGNEFITVEEVITVGAADELCVVCVD